MRLRLYKRLRLPSVDPRDESPSPLLNTWDEDDFLPNGMGIPVPAPDEQEWDPEEPADDEVPAEERGKLLHLPLFSDDPPDGEET